MIARLTQSLSAFAVFAALAGLAIWGHATGWQWHFTHRTKPGAETTNGPRLADRTTLTFDTVESVERAGIEIAPVWTAAVTDAIIASGEVSFDPTHLAELSSRVSGVVARVCKNVGDDVQPGETLALIDSIDVAKAKSEFQEALVLLRSREKIVTSIGASTAVPERQRQELEAAQREAEVGALSAEQALINLGLPVRMAEYRGLAPAEVAERLRRLGQESSSPAAALTEGNLLPLRAPFAGKVLTLDVVYGEVVEAGRPLIKIVDPTVLWLTMHVTLEDVRRVAVGQPVRFRPDGSRHDFEARLTWIGTAANETTRTVPVRANVRNDAGLLRASTLGRGRIIVSQKADTVVVPPEAIQFQDGKPVVFVRDPDFLKPDGPKSFHARPVQIGIRDGQAVEVTAGLRVGEIIAVKNSSGLLTDWKRLTAHPTPTKKP